MDDGRCIDAEFGRHGFTRYSPSTRLAIARLPCDLHEPQVRSGAGPRVSPRPRVITVEDSPADGGAVGRSLTTMVGTKSGARRRSTTAMLACANGSHRAG
jgi:hypothetical protein